MTRRVCRHRLQARQGLVNGALIQLMMHNVVYFGRRTPIFKIRKINRLETILLKTSLL